MPSIARRKKKPSTTGHNSGHKKTAVKKPTVKKPIVRKLILKKNQSKK